MVFKTYPSSKVIAATLLRASRCSRSALFCFVLLFLDLGPRYGPNQQANSQQSLFFKKELKTFLVGKKYYRKNKKLSAFGSMHTDRTLQPVVNLIT
jgi:hypothetical protein